MIAEMFLTMGEFGAAGMYEEPDRTLFYRKSLGIRRFYEKCELPVYNGEKLYPSGVMHTSMAVKPHYMNGMTIDYNAIKQKNGELANQLLRDFGRYQSAVPKEHTVAGDMYTHSMPNYERILKEGFFAALSRIEKIQDTDIKEGLKHVITGIQNYLARSIRYLESVQADEKLIDALKKVPMHPAENIYEALVGWNFILYLDQCDNLGCVATGLLPYYKGENVTDILRNLFDNLDVNNGYSMALGTDYNPLTYQCLEAAKGKRRPMIELFVNEHTPEEVWNKAFESIRSSNGQPAFYNPALLNDLQARFPAITAADIRKFCGGGCTESMLAGLSNVGSLDAGINLLLILEKNIRTDLASAKSFTAFYETYISSVGQVVRTVTEAIRRSQKERAVYNPLPMRTLLIDNCIDKGLDYNNGGAKYQWSIINFAGMINVIDSMLVIRDFIFRDRLYQADDFVQMLAENNSDFLQKARTHPVCFGNDNEEVNRFAKKISTDIYALLDNEKPYFGEGFLPSSIQFQSQVGAGKNIGATPDGRASGTPLCDSLGAIFGKDTKGPTALLKSVTSLDLKRALGVPVLNFNINPTFRNDILKALILGYMELGGVQIQITCISREILESAYRNPELHKNLVVRVGGYSEYFYRLSDELKRMVIARTIQSEV